MWQPQSDILVTDLGDELVLMHPQRSEMFSLNAAGRLLWTRLPASLEELTAVLVQTYGLDPAQARADAAAVLDELNTRDLIKQAPD